MNRQPARAFWGEFEKKRSVARKAERGREKTHGNIFLSFLTVQSLFKERLLTKNTRVGSYETPSRLFRVRCTRHAGQVAQLVEQRTENPCVGGSIPSLTTKQA